ncbi:MAG TPA: hypothetical protein VGO26_08175 [Amnibacterium sp.]|jgi:hypothetical protein|nr:hypothetical protein [Amnibacterium sp.]
MGDLGRDRCRARLGRSGAGHAGAITGIVLAVVGVLAALVELTVRIPLFLGVQHGEQTAVIRSAVLQQAGDRGVRITEMSCPATASPSGAADGRGGWSWTARPAV